MPGDNMTPPEDKPATPVNNSFKDDDETIKDLVSNIQQPTQVKNTVNDAEVADTQATQAKAPEAKKMLSAGLSAEIAISCLDGIQAGLFTAIANRKLKRRMGDDLEEVEELDEKLKQKVVNLSEMDGRTKLLVKYKKYKRLLELMEDIPFTEDEVKRMEAPLEAMIIENNYQMPPWLGFTLVISDVMIKRTVTAIFD